jgi:hypothetical protein
MARFLKNLSWRNLSMAKIIISTSTSTAAKAAADTVYSERYLPPRPSLSHFSFDFEIGNKSSEFDATLNHPRMEGSFIYEPFLSSQNQEDIKVYTVER